MTERRSGETVIDVRMVAADEPRQFEVVVREESGETHYQITMRQTDFERLGDGKLTPEACVRAGFLFLLDHEPKDLILRRFDFSVIELYFPEFAAEFPKYWDRK